MDKETRWKARRIGMITASELGEITSASGRIIDGNLSYIRAKRWERLHGFTHPVTARQMEIGNEQEPYAVMWARTNLPECKDLVYSKDLPDIPFWVSKVCPMGASPDAYTPDESIVVECKTLVGATAIEYFGDEFTSYEEKKAAVWKDHGDQILGQFLSNDKVKEIWLLKYIYQDDDILEDIDSPTAPWRGLVFKFSRDSYAGSLECLRQRTILIDAMISAPINPSEFKSGTWVVDEQGLHRK